MDDNLSQCEKSVALEIQFQASGNTEDFYYYTIDADVIEQSKDIKKGNSVSLNASLAVWSKASLKRIDSL